MCAGIYHLTLSDTTNSIHTSFAITEPTQLSIIINADTALCFGGTAQASAYSYGGQYPYQTLWDNGSTGISTYLYSGQHSVTVTDANGCVTSESVNIIENDQININLIGTDISCFGLSNGSVEINIMSGGTPPYTYSNNNGQSFQNNNIFSNLNPGVHYYTIRDVNDCLSSDSIIVNEPNELLSTITFNNVSCYGYCDGNAIANISGGTPPYLENWGGLDQNNLCAGLVNLIVEDINGCLSTSSIIISEPNQIIINIDIIGNTLVVDSNFLFYQWIDNNGTNIMGETSYSFTPNQGGIYAVEVTDSNLCTITSEYFNFIIENIDNLNNNFMIYPNPTNGFINLTITEKLPNKIRILNMLGATILELNSEEITNNNIINLSYYNKGSYLIELINNNTIITRKITLQ